MKKTPKTRVYHSLGAIKRQFLPKMVKEERLKEYVPPDSLAHSLASRSLKKLKT